MNTEVKKQSPAQALRAQIEGRSSEFTKALPSTISPDQFVAVLTRAVMANNDLVLADRISFFESALAAALDGLMPDGKEGAIVIFNTKVKIAGEFEWIKKAQWLPMVRGIINKIYNTGLVRSITVGVAYEGDDFRAWTDDTGEHLFYEEGDEQNTAVVKRYFAAVFMKDGGRFVETMRPDEVAKVRQSSKSKDTGPWSTWPEEMAKKTVLKRLAKRLPLSREIQQVIDRDNFLYEDDMRDITPAAHKRPRDLGARLDRLAGLSGQASVSDQTSSSDSVPFNVTGDGEHEPVFAENESASPSSAPTSSAFDAGREAAKNGMSRRAMPAHYRDDQKLSEEWMAGFGAGKSA